MKPTSINKLDPQFKHVRQWFDNNLDSEKCDLNDQHVYENVFHKGKWAAIFQATERGMQNLLQKAKPRSITDLAALTSIYRPGPLAAGVDKAYVQDKEREERGEKLEYMHPILEKVLGPTRGHMCLHGGSKILLSDGSTMAIEDIVKGKLHVAVKSWNIEESTWQDDEVIGWIDSGINPCITIMHSEGSITCTGNHPILTDSGWKEAERLKVGDAIRSHPISLSWAKIMSISWGGWHQTYDITVKNNSNFVANGIIVHNCFQEQFMLLGYHFGLNWDDCDKLRKILVKKSIGTDVNEKKRQEALRIKTEFKHGAMDKGLTEKQVDELWEKMEYFSGSGFNLCLAADEHVDVIINGKLQQMKISEIKRGMSVMTRDEKTLRDHPVDVVDVHHNGVRHVNRYTLEDGTTVVCTPDHKFRTTCGQMLSINEIIQRDLSIYKDMVY